MASKTERFGDLPQEEQASVIRDWVLRVAEDEAFHAKLAIVPVLVRMQEDLEALAKAVVENRRAIEALTGRAPAAVAPENPGYRQLRWTQGTVPVATGKEIGVNDTRIPDAVQDRWSLNPLDPERIRSHS